MNEKEIKTIEPVESFEVMIELEELEAAAEVMHELGLTTLAELENEIKRRHALLDSDDED